MFKFITIYLFLIICACIYIYKDIYLLLVYVSVYTYVTCVHVGVTSRNLYPRLSLHVYLHVCVSYINRNNDICACVLLDKIYM